MNQNENPPTLLWVKYIWDGDNVLEINSAESDVEKIVWTGPGMIEIRRPGGIVDSIVSDRMFCRTKVDQVKKIVMPDKDIAMPS